MKRRPGKWDTLEGVLQEVWAMLKQGVADFDDPFHWPVLGTSAKDGSRLRCVILRQLMLPERILVCHTDARANKVQEILNCVNVSWLFYHPQRKVQLRISGSAELHANDEFADEQWAATKITTRLNYCATQPPGTHVDRPSSGIPDLLIKGAATLLSGQRGRENFMAIACRIDAIDWLKLSTLGNRRARFDWDENKLKAVWLIP
jgi:hypothetical protein